ncbi:MAG TPA: transglycosylase domain-containing protein, partial [Candidatus Absconditabacterales bacterium]|nr:transglycosylase domain-containing protein [Candidatus Absconditabacterales bacterium]
MSKFVGAHYYRKPNWFQTMKHKYRSFEISGAYLWLPVIFLFIPLVVLSVLFYTFIIRELPDLKKVESLNLSQTTTITDRNGEVLYRVFDENREYIPLGQISPMMQNAIIAAEDKSFWSNAGIDFMGIARAIVRDIGGGASQGGSTITQQLVKNLLLTPEKSIKRKLKELVLTIKIGDLLKKQVEKNSPGISNKERDRKVKEKILELYLNYIFLGNNSYGVQAASKTYFSSKADTLGVFESSVLAAIPKAPSKFDPYKNRAGLVGELEVIDPSGEKVELTGSLQIEILNKVRSIMDDSRLKSKTSSEDMLKYLQGLIDFEYTTNNELYKIKYVPGRKDYVIARMYEDSYITIEEVKDAIIKGMHYSFSRAKITIDSPHFVFWILDLLKEENNKYIGSYGEDMLKKGGLVIKTTLDLKIQQMALDSIQESIGSIKSYGGNNTALIHLDSKNGDVLAYVGSADYYNEAIDGNVDVIQRPRQPGSTIKPLWYALGFMTIPLTLDTTIFDIPFKLGEYDPDNADGKFMGPMSLRRALAFSRNIPAIKMYFAAGEQDAFIDFAQAMGVKTFSKSKNYGPPMAIGAAEMEMFELATMYSHLSAGGKPGSIDPILEIRRPDGSIVYKKSDIRPKQVISAGIAYLLWKILSDPANLPGDWAKKFNFPGIKFAHKTGTSNRRSGEKILPRDGWLATYTPSKVTLFRAGNTSGKPMHADAYGGRVNHSTWNKFWTKLKTNGYLRNEDMKPVEVKQLTISKYSGKLASEQTPSAMRVSTWGFIDNLPTDYDGGVRKVEIDRLCMGKISELTPASDIITVYINEPQTFMPDKKDLKDIMRYTGKGYSYEIFDSSGSQIQGDTIYAEPTEECIQRRFLSGEQGSLISGEIPSLQHKDGISTSIIKPLNGETVGNTISLWYTASSSKQITTIDILVNGNNVQTISYDQPSITDLKTIDLSNLEGSLVLGIKATAEDGKTSTSSIQVTKPSTQVTNQLPLLLTNQITVKLENGIYKVVLFFTDYDGKVVEGIIKKNGATIASFNGSTATLELQTLGILSYEVVDNNDGKTQGSID